MTKLFAILLAAGAGAATMYYSDPVRGRARRAVVRDKARAVFRDVADMADKGRRDLGNHLCGVAAGARHWVERERVPDDILVDRVRAHLGRAVSLPHAIEVHARQGTVILSGPVLAGEFHDLLAAVEHTPGVRDIECHVNVHATRDIPALQGGRLRRAAAGWACDPGAYSPAVRLLTGVTGAGLTLYGLGRGGLRGVVLMPTGMALLAWGLYSPRTTARRAQKVPSVTPPPVPLTTVEEVLTIQAGYSDH